MTLLNLPVNVSQSVHAQLSLGMYVSTSESAPITATRSVSQSDDKSAVTGETMPADDIATPTTRPEVCTSDVNHSRRDAGAKYIYQESDLYIIRLYPYSISITN